MDSVRIAAGAGYAGDRIEPALDIIRRGNADYIIFECLAERSIALAQLEKMKAPEKGYNPLLDYRMQKVIPLLAEHPVKIVTNMGAANPTGAARRIQAIAAGYGMPQLRIAAVEGDDVLDTVLNTAGLRIMETGETLDTLRGSIISANAYIGGRAISEALAMGADIVITGRVADPCLVTGPLMHEYGRGYDDFDFLGKTIVAGHLLECAGQVTGGYYADPGKKDVPELWNLGFPILTFHRDGSLLLEKLPGTGGLLDTHTVKEQLLYEIQDPTSYLTPDVVADFSRLQVEQAGEKVRVSGAGGAARTGLVKVSVGYEDGWIGTGEISYGGHNCAARAQLAQEVIRHRVRQIGLQPQEIRFDLLGVNSLYRGLNALPKDLPEVRLRVAARSKTETQAALIAQEVEALYTNGPAGGGGARSQVSKMVSIASVLLPEKEVHTSLVWFGGQACEIV